MAVAFKQSTSYTKMVLLISSTDHVAGLAGATLTITASKAGAAFATITPTVTDRGSGFYSLALTGAHLDTLGDFVLHVTATGADPTDTIDQVIAQDLNVANVTANVVQVAGTSQTARDLGAQLDATVSSRVGLSDVVEGTTTVVQMLRGYASVLFGKAAGQNTTSATFRDLADTKDRVTATLDGTGNRTAVTRDLT